jgi:hypothetical protein
MTALRRSAWVAVLLSPFYLSVHSAGQVGYGPAPRYPPDSLGTHQTRFEVAGGYGGYASVRRGCGGNVLRADHVNVADFGAAVEHEFPNHAVVGVRGGRIREWMDAGDVPEVPGLPEGAGDLELITTYVNPYIALNGGPGGLGIGWLHAFDRPLPSRTTVIDGVPARGFEGSELGKHQVSAHFRGGSLQRTYFVVSYNEGLPLYTSGILHTGVGFNPSPHIGAQLGVNWLHPNDRPGAYLELDFRASEPWTIGLKSRVGRAADTNEAAIGLAIRYRWVH